MQRAVIAAQFFHTIVDMSKQTILRQGRQGAHHAAKGDIAAGFKTGWSAVEKAECRQDAFLWSSAGRAHFCRSINGSPRGLVGGNRRLRNRDLIGAGLAVWSGLGSVSRPCWMALRRVSGLRPRCSATSLRFQPAPRSCCAWAVTSGVITEAPRVARGV